MNETSLTPNEPATPSPVAAQTLREQVVHAEATLKAAREAYAAAEFAARTVRYRAEGPAHETLASLKETYAERAHELSIAARKCPYTRSGGHMEPDEVSVRESGICLSWDINGNYAPEWFIATWEALTAATGEEGSPQ